MDAVKLVDIDKGLIEGWAIPFGGPMPGGKDFDGEAFTPETELYLGNHETRPLKYHHGKDGPRGRTHWSRGQVGAERRRDLARGTASP